MSKTVKIIDFGISIKYEKKKFNKKSYFTKIIGTSKYMAPEMSEGRYSY